MSDKGHKDSVQAKGDAQTKNDAPKVDEFERAAAQRELVDVLGRLTPTWIKWLHRTASPAGLSPARLRVLGTLLDDGPSIMHHISDELGVTPRAITGLIDGLEEDGLVERQRHPSDRRATVIVLTDQGRKVTESWWEEHLDHSAEVFAVLDPSEQRSLLRILRKLEGPLNAALDEVVDAT